MLFDSADAANKFTYHVAIARFGASDQQSVVSMDTLAGKGKVKCIDI